MFNVLPEVVPHKVTWQAWRSLVTPWVARHRRHSSWRLWGSHILLLCILHICSLSHCECNGMCNQLWSIHTYPINLLFSYIPLFFIIFIIIIIILVLLWKVVHIQLWHCFDAAKCVFIYLFIQYICVVLFHSFGIHRPFGLWYCIWNAAHKMFGGYV